MSDLTRIHAALQDELQRAERLCERLRAAIDALAADAVRPALPPRALMRSATAARRSREYTELPDVAARRQRLLAEIGEGATRIDLYKKLPNIRKGTIDNDLHALMAKGALVRDEIDHIYVYACKQTEAATP